VTRVLVDGRADGRIDPLDRGLQYGDGLFETIAIAAGRPRLIDWHLERLAEGADRLGMRRPDDRLLRDEIRQVSGAPQAVVKVLLTRGNGERGYRAPKSASPRRIVMGFDWPAFPAMAAVEGVRVGWCRTRLGRNPALAGLKHLNRLEQVLGRSEWEDGAMDEGLMQDDRGQVVSATQSNLFARLDGRWVTPRLDQCGVAGVMRRAFRQWQAGQGAPVEERELGMADVERAQSLLLTNALVGAWPVRELAGRRLPIDPDARAFNVWLETA
jgi:4-amino-4-deoxychorismate lyase